MAAGRRGFVSPNAGRRLTLDQRNSILRAKPRPGTAWSYEQKARELGVATTTLKRIWGLRPVYSSKIPPEKQQRILELLKHTNLPRSKIAKAVTVARDTVRKLETPSTARTPKKNKRTNFFSPARKREILGHFSGVINSCASARFRMYKKFFLATGVDSALELAQEIRLKLLEQLDYFDPEREKLKGLTEEQKIEHFVNFKIPKIAAELARKATRKKTMKKKFRRSAARPSSGRATEPLVKNPPMALIGLHEFAKLPFGLQEEIINELIRRMPLLQKRPLAIKEAIRQRSMGLTWKKIAENQKVSDTAPAALLLFYKSLMRRTVQQIIQERKIRV
ncbi:MAG: hypothetical protein PHD95_03750 [Candidatus ainarchaeum sp.]|nr:hypothetical protein [Candidatus ainarchaeum sp.]